MLGVLWWCWVGYAWLTSVIDPEEDAVRLVIFAAMAALLVVGLPHAPWPSPLTASWAALAPRAMTLVAVTTPFPVGSAQELP